MDRPPSDTGRILWGCLLAVAGALEVYGITKPGCDLTLSELTRWSFRTNTRAGRAVFSLGWLAFASWYWGHVLNKD